MAITNRLAVGDTGTEPPSAAAKVLGVTELLEAILIQLPNTDLLNAQGICKTRKIPIQTSASIQTALCIRASKPAKGQSSKYPNHTFGSVFETPKFSLGSTARELLGLLNATTYHLNPLFVQAFTGISNSAMLGKDFGFKVRAIKHIPEMSIVNEMYLTQPPAIRLQVVIKTAGEDVTRSVTNRRGIMVADLRRLVLDQVFYDLAGPYTWCAIRLRRGGFVER